MVGKKAILRIIFGGLVVATLCVPIAIFGIVNSTSVNAASANKSSTVTSKSSNPLSKDVMPIGAWIAPPPVITGVSGKSYITTARYKEVKDAGINLIYGLYERGNGPDVRNALNAAQKNGIKYIVRDDRLFNAYDPADTSFVELCIDNYKNHPGYGGNLIVDEPGAVSFDLLGKLKKTFSKVATKGYYYINIMPTYATSGQLYYGASSTQTNTISYDQYLTQYLAKVNPSFLSYDYYPMIGTFPNVTSDYFRNMSIVRSKTIKKGIPFWVFIQTCSYGNGVRVPTKEEIFWQVNTALAYGAKGIQYFTYWTPPDATEFDSGMITRDGKKTVRYSYVQQINRQIAAIDKVLMNTKSKGIIVHGSTPAPIDGAEKIKSFAPVNTVTGSDAMIGCFQNSAGKKQLYVVNSSLENKGSVTINFNKISSCLVWQKALSKKVNTLKGLKLALDPGEGVLVEIN